MDDAVSRELAKQDWEEIHARLVKFLLGRKATEVMAEDIAQQAIERVFACDSEWDPERYPVLLTYLIGVARMLLFKERRAAKRFVTHDHHAEEDGDPLDEHRDERALGPDRIAETDLHARRLALLRTRLAARDDDEAIRVLELHIDGVERPAEIATATGWPVGKVNRARDRMQRTALQVAADLSGELASPGVAAQDEDDEEEVA